MSKGEFDIIKRYFDRDKRLPDDVEIGIGDDCAVLKVPPGFQLAVTTDSLVSGVHFFADVDAYRLGYKALAVNLSDLAAMGANAKWVSLAITLPCVDETWLQHFCRGFFALADKYNVTLIGGDTTKGPLSITVSAMGLVQNNKALTRSNAQVGDVICVSGVLGDGAAGLAVKQKQVSFENAQYFIDALELAEPCLALSEKLVGYASSCIDISDGLSQDLSHILSRSHCSAEIALEQLPLSDALQCAIKKKQLSQHHAWQFALAGGDDYKLLFTVPKEKLTILSAQLSAVGLAYHEVGSIIAISDDPTQESQNIATGPTINYTHKQQPIEISLTGWDHFK